MTLLEAAVLGIVQGLTEFLPISSTAHLKIVPTLLGWEDPGASYSAVLQIGTVVAVLAYFRRDILAITAGIYRGLRTGKPLQDPHGRLGIYVAVGSVPIVFFGLLFQKWIKHELRSLYVIAGALVLVGVVMAVADHLAQRRRTPLPTAAEAEDLTGVTLGDAIWVGLAQACALVPGVSRSGSTLAAGLFRGLDRARAARFSFLLSIPAVTGAGLKELYELVKEGGLAGDGALHLAVGTLVSFIVGYAAIAGLLAFLRTRSVLVFVVYRVVLGIALFGLAYSGAVVAG